LERKAMKMTLKGDLFQFLCILAIFVGAYAIKCGVFNANNGATFDLTELTR
jgi:hypothetical protein